MVIRELTRELAGSQMRQVMNHCSAPDTWIGRRDHALLTMTVQTGLRISEICSLTNDDIHLGAGPHIACPGKGRRQRVTPLTRATVCTSPAQPCSAVLTTAGVPRCARAPPGQKTPRHRDEDLCQPRR